MGILSNRTRHRYQRSSLPETRGSDWSTKAIHPGEIAITPKMFVTPGTLSGLLYVVTKPKEYKREPRKAITTNICILLYSRVANNN